MNSDEECGLGSGESMMTGPSQEWALVADNVEPHSLHPGFLRDAFLRPEISSLNFPDSLASGLPGRVRQLDNYRCKIPGKEDEAEASFLLLPFCSVGKYSGGDIWFFCSSRNERQVHNIYMAGVACG